MTTKLPPRYPGRGGLPLPEELHLPADNVRVNLDPDAPDDHEPLPDGMEQEEHYLDLVTVIRAFFWGRPGVLTQGHTPVYYDDADGRQQIFYADCYVAFGVDPLAIRRRNGYFIQRVGKAPDFALEIASESTVGDDLGPKRTLYARLGIGEYWRFDPTGNYYPEPLAGEVLVDGEYRPIDIRRNIGGVVQISSPTLGLDLCWDKGRLRFLERVGEYLRTLEEAEAQILVERAGRQAAEALLRVARADGMADQYWIGHLEEELRRLRTES